MSGISLSIFCPQCKVKRDARDVQQVVLPNGKPALEGQCPTCGTKLFQVVYPNACQ